jgi:formamidopyrimidine-DNA glycosylase
MPEGHTLHRLATELTDAFAGHPLRVSSPQGRFAAEAAQLDRAVLLTAESAGKHLFLDFDADRVVHVHLGLIGGFDVHRGVAEVPLPVGQVRLRLVRDGERASYADLRGATQCDLVTTARRTEIVARLGPDPLRPDADPMRAWLRISKSPRASATSTAPRCCSGTASTRCGPGARCEWGSGEPCGPTSSA